jgi:hypothetical protein
LVPDPDLLIVQQGRHQRINVVWIGVRLAVRTGPFHRATAIPCGWRRVHYSCVCKISSGARRLNGSLSWRTDSDAVGPDSQYRSLSVRTGGRWSLEHGKTRVRCCQNW